MPRILPFVLAVIAITFAACSGSRAEPTATPTPRPTATPEPPAVYFPRWPAYDLPISYCITGASGYVPVSEFRALVASAFDAWGVAAIDDGDCVSDAPRQDRQNQVGWRAIGSTSDNYYEAGLTTRYAECDVDCRPSEEPLLTEADIQIDPDTPEYYRSSECLESVIVHEVGHFLGLEHLPSPSVMETGGTSCSSEITPLDRRALEARYGPQGDGRDLVEDDELAVTELISFEFDLFQAQDWELLYELYSPGYQDLCPYARFVANNEAASSASDLDPELISFANLDITVRGGIAEATYDYLYDDEITTSVDASSPDSYVKIDGRWYDDVDEHTSCE